MKAAVVVTPGTLAMETVPDPTPGPLDVVVSDVRDEGALKRAEPADHEVAQEG